jgi:hypothetical protein
LKSRHETAAPRYPHSASHGVVDLYGVADKTELLDHLRNVHALIWVDRDDDVTDFEHMHDVEHGLLHWDHDHGE